jgi:hypothetical protein
LFSPNPALKRWATIKPSRWDGWVGERGRLKG